MNLDELYSRVSETVSSLDFGRIWPGFRPLKFALYDDEKCFYDGMYIEKSDDFCANTSINFQGEQIAIWKVVDDLPIPVLASKIVHEMFHGYQTVENWNCWADEMEALYRYQYNADNLSLKLRENELLLRILDHFDEASYQRNNLKQNVSVSNGDAVYKLISNEEWHIVVPITNTLADELADDNTLKLRFNKDGKTAYATYVITEKSGEKYLILTLRNSLVRYAKDRFIEIELLLTEQTGLKIPNSAITEKEFFTIPVSYFMKGGDSDADGLLVSSTNKNGKTTTEFVSPTIYYTTDDYYYIDSENVTAGDILVKPDSNETYRVGSDTATLKGVYNVNKGYAVFKQIDILYQSKEYTIVKTGTSYGISLYDHIALDGAKINEDDLLK